MGELGLKRLLHTSINLTNSLVEIFITYSFCAASREFLDFGLENVLTVKGNKDFKMSPMPILTKWLAAGQRAHNSRSMFSTHTGNVTYSFYLTQLHKLSLSEHSLAPAEAQGADSGPSPHKQNIAIALTPNFVSVKRLHSSFAERFVL